MDIEEQKQTLLSIIEDTKQLMENYEIFYKIYEDIMIKLEAERWKLEKDLRVNFSALMRFEQILKGTYAPHTITHSRITPFHKREREEVIDL